MTHPQDPTTQNRAYRVSRKGVLSRTRWAASVGMIAAALALAGCAAPAVSEGANPGDAAAEHEPASESEPTVESEPTAVDDDAAAETADAPPQEETCDWDSPRLSRPAEVPEGEEGELAEVLVGSWQHTHTDGGSGFEEVTNDHRFVFTSPDRMLYCQHVPGATEHAENAADIVLNGTKIELPGGQYAYTVTAWNADTLVWDNPVGGGYVYLLQRR